MDNEAPNYASWVPEAGGYVANGKVVSKSPIYDEAGKLKLDVDTTVFGNTQSTTSKNQPQVANQPITNNGITTANTTGSGTDANAQATGIGSLNSMSQNTQNAVDSALSSPAMRSPSAGEPILTVEQQDLKEIQDAHARNDIQGEINGYVKLARDTGVDYTQTINDLTRQRQNKIQTTDDNYLQQLNDVKQRLDTAKSVGDITGDYTAYKQALAEYGALLDEQDKWRNAVGYEDAMRDKFQQQEEELKIDYDFTYLNSVRAFSDQLIQMIPALMNFQYDPAQDSNLLRAQALVEMRMRNNAAATGMYYSSTTQYAIAQAIGELVPVYQKMAKEEAVENFKLLQSTASFLMDLEQTQFDMWKAQIQMKWAENDERRKAIDQAIQNANARGYYTNEEAALLGIAPGTESQAARERALDKQDQIEKELRNLEQDMTLAEFKNGLSIQLAQEEARLKERQIAVEAQYKDWVNQRNAYYDSIYGNSNNTTTTSPKYEVTINPDGTKTVKITGTGSYDQFTGGVVDAAGNPIATVGDTSGDGWSGIANMYGSETASLMKENYTKLGVDKLDFSNKNAVTEYSDTLREALTKAATKNLNEGISAMKDYINPDTSKNFVGPTKTVTPQDVGEEVNIIPHLAGTYLQKAKQTIAKNSNDYGAKESQTADAISNSSQALINMIGDLSRNGDTEQDVKEKALAMYTELFQSIENGDDKFDYPKYASKKNNVTDIHGIIGVLDSRNVTNQGNMAKEDAMIALIQDIVNTQSMPATIKAYLAEELSNQAWTFAKKVGNSGYIDLTNKGSWRYLSPNTVSKI